MVDIGIYIAIGPANGSVEEGSLPVATGAKVTIRKYLQGETTHTHLDAIML